MISAIPTSQLYNQYTEALRQVADVKYANAVLQWDQETYLPPLGVEARSRQLATLSEVAHNLFTSEKLGAVLNELKSRTSLNERQQKNIELSLEDYTKVKKFSSAFVKQMSEAVSAAYHAWIKARKHNDFSIFEGPLAKIVALKQQEAAIIGYQDHPYNALLNEYERGATVQYIDKVFADIKQPLKQLLGEVEQQQATINTDFLNQHFPRNQQWQYGQHLAKMLGFNFNAGRQDISEHPFTTNFSTNDVRITTRIDEHDFANMTWSTIHEVGHALYEQGLPAGEYGLPVGEYASLGIHESQSRLWENCVCRGLPFWQFHFKPLQEFFPGMFNHISVEEFVRAINKVKPSLIRTEADELTYHFHVMIRYEIEKLLISGTLLVKDLPAYWNEQYRQLLGVTVPNHTSGCLQDVHWSHGSFGYFATYSLGSFYAAQLWQQVQTDHPQLISTIQTTGKTQILLQWLRTNVHAHGKLYNSETLCKNITGEGLNSTIFLNYLRNKLVF